MEEIGVPAAQPASDSEKSFDQILQRLRVVVERLEGSELSLEESLATFEEGVRLSRRGAEILNAAERRVEVLLRASDGSLKTAPFEVDQG